MRIRLSSLPEVVEDLAKALSMCIATTVEEQVALDNGQPNTVKLKASTHTENGQQPTRSCSIIRSRIVHKSSMAFSCFCKARCMELSSPAL